MADCKHKHTRPGHIRLERVNAQDETLEPARFIPEQKGRLERCDCCGAMRWRGSRWPAEIIE